MLKKPPQTQICVQTCLKCQTQHNPRSYSPYKSYIGRWYCNICNETTDMLLGNVNRKTLVGNQWSIDTTPMLPYIGSDPRNLYLISCPGSTDPGYIQPNEVAEIFYHILNQKGVATLFDNSQTIYDFVDMKSTSMANIRSLSGEVQTVNIANLLKNEIKRIEIKNTDLLLVETISEGFNITVMKAIE